MNQHHIFVSTALLVSALALPGCDKLTDAVQKGAEAVADADAEPGHGAVPSEDDLLGAKLNGYIGCINRSSEAFHRSVDRYFDWVDHEAGLTGKERNVYGIYAIADQKACIDGVAASNEAAPDLPKLEAAGTAYVAALSAMIPIVDQANKYYDDKDYKDDKFAKGLELHPKLVAAFKALEEADQGLREIVKEQNEKLQARELVHLEQEEGRKLIFLSKNLMAKAKPLMKSCDAESLDAMDLEALQAALKDYEAAVDEAEQYSKAHEKETGTVMMYSRFSSAATDLKKEAKALMRRKRDNKQFTDAELAKFHSAPHLVEGNPASVSAKYNDLVARSNGLSWQRYQPDP